MLAPGRSPDVQGHPFAYARYRWFERLLWGSHASRRVRCQSSTAARNLARQRRPLESAEDPLAIPARHVVRGTEEWRREWSSSARIFAQPEWSLGDPLSG